MVMSCLFNKVFLFSLSIKNYLSSIAGQFPEYDVLGGVPNGIKLIKIAVIYFLVGICIGFYMSATHSFSLATVHVHINLLGWMSLSLAGIFYHLFPYLTETTAAKVHFWLHNIGLPVMMISIALAIYGAGGIFFPIATAGGAITVIGIFCFGYNVLKNIK